MTTLTTVRLHNQLISSMLHNASSPYGANVPPHTPLSANSKRKRQDEALSTIDDTNRVQGWVLGLPRKERVRVKKLIEKEYDAALAVEGGVGVRESARGRTKRRGKGMFATGLANAQKKLHRSHVSLVFTTDRYPVPLSCNNAWPLSPKNTVSAEKQASALASL